MAHQGARVFLGKRSFWLMFVGQTILATSFGLAGTVQIYHYWILAEPWQKVIAARSPSVPEIAIGGAIVFLGYLFLATTMFRRILLPIKEEIYTSPVAKKSYFNTLSGFPSLVILAVVFALIGTAGLWSFSLSSVIQSGQVWIPYSLSVIAYAGLAIMAILMASKLARSLEHGYHP